MDMPSLAVRQYKVALSRAYERDDAGAIGDVAYNLALAQMKAGDSKDAVATVRETRAELDRRRVAVPPSLILVQAAAAYRSGDLGRRPPPSRSLDRPRQDPDAVRRAWFIRGLVAADRGDAAPRPGDRRPARPTKQADLEADRQELQGRAALLDNRPAERSRLFEQSADQPPAGARLSRHGACLVAGRRRGCAPVAPPTPPICSCGPAAAPCCRATWRPARRC